MSSKETQVEANYRRGDPINHCGVCGNFLGRGQCSAVMGNISPFGISDEFKTVKNPFGPTLAPQEIQAIKAMAADAQDRSGQVTQAAPPGQPMRPPQPAPPPQQQRPQPFFG